MESKIYVPERTSASQAQYCTIIPSDSEMIFGKLIELSDNCLSFDSRQAPEVGEEIEVRIFGVGVFAGLVRWNDGLRASCDVRPLERAARPMSLRNGSAC